MSKLLNNKLRLLVCLRHYSRKTSGLLFIFICASTGHTHFQNNEIHISWGAARPAMVFFSSETTEITTRKAGFEICGAQFSIQKRNPPSRKSLLVHQCNISLFNLYFSYTWAVFIT